MNIIVTEGILNNAIRKAVELGRQMERAEHGERPLFMSKREAMNKYGVTIIRNMIANGVITPVKKGVGMNSKYYILETDIEAALYGSQVFNSLSHAERKELADAYRSEKDNM
ncbi:MAG: hypothetical protein J6M59_05300 [Bacteroidaceae bacterium]|nr:hypothetical protein [Bacteroidaceae bacterium]